MTEERNEQTNVAWDAQLAKLRKGLIYLVVLI